MIGTSKIPALGLTSGAELRAVARRRLLAEPVSGPDVAGTRDFQHPSDFDLNPGLRPETAGGLKPAAVLVPIVVSDPLTVLLTERTAHLAAHAGQIAFPGGKIEPGDASPLAAALREAHEEIGLTSSLVEPLGYIEPYRTSTGFLITPVVAAVSPSYTLAPDPDEVADVFTVPFDFLMNDANHRIDNVFWRGADRRFYSMPYEGRYIWGATAGIIRALHRRLFAE